MLDRERLSAITDNVVYDEPMSKHTTFRIGGTADAFVSPENALEIEKINLFDDIPKNLTYPAIQPYLFERVQEFLETK